MVCGPACTLIELTNMCESDPKLALRCNLLYEETQLHVEHTQTLMPKHLYAKWAASVHAYDPMPTRKDRGMPQCERVKA